LDFFGGFDKIQDLNQDQKKKKKKKKKKKESKRKRKINMNINIINQLQKLIFINNKVVTYIL